MVEQCIYCDEGAVMDHRVVGQVCAECALLAEQLDAGMRQMEEQ